MAIFEQIMFVPKMLMIKMKLLLQTYGFNKDIKEEQTIIAKYN